MPAGGFHREVFAVALVEAYASDAQGFRDEAGLLDIALANIVAGNALHPPPRHGDGVKALVTADVDAVDFFEARAEVGFNHGVYHFEAGLKIAVTSAGSFDRVRRFAPRSNS